MTSEATKKREVLEAKLNEVIEARKQAHRLYQLARSMDAGVKSGIYLAYLVDPLDGVNKIIEARYMRRISQRALWEADYHYESLLADYAKAKAAIVEQMTKYVEAKLAA